MTKDLAIIKLGTSKVPRSSYLNTEEFIDAVATTINKYVRIEDKKP
jgi:isocitrate dehydrogenase